MGRVVNKLKYMEKENELGKMTTAVPSGHELKKDSVSVCHARRPSAVGQKEKEDRGGTVKVVVGMEGDSVQGDSGKRDGKRVWVETDEGERR